MKNRFKTILICVLALVLVVSSISSVSAQTPPFQGEDYIEMPVTINGERAECIAYTIKGNLYVSTDALVKYGDTSKIRIDKDARKVYFNTADLDLNFGDPETSAYIKNNAGECYVPIKYFLEDFWVSLGSISQIVKLAYRYEDGKLHLNQYSKLENLAIAGNTAESVASLSNKGIVSLSTGERVFIRKESASFYKVENMDGEVFYVNKDQVTRTDSASFGDFEFIPKQKAVYDRPINLVWHNLADSAVRTPTPPASSDNSRQPGIDVVSPPWIHQLVNGNGNVSHICDYGYVELAHSLGYQVWITVNNLFTTTGSTAYTSKVMADEKLSDKVIAQYLLYACLHDADGINLDYEDLLKADRDNFAGFCEKLAYHCNKLGLVFAVDTSIPTSYNTMYDWTRLGETCDYVIPMTYVEHMGNSVGSVSSHSWYSFYMNNLKNYVPSKKILMGVPFFTRYYTTDASGRIIKTATLTMTSAYNRAVENNASIVWDESEGQNIATWKDGSNTTKVWLEDARSMLKRINHVKEAELGGSACWAIEQVGEGILEMFERNYNE